MKCAWCPNVQGVFSGDYYYKYVDVSYANLHFNVCILLYKNNVSLRCAAARCFARRRTCDRRAYILHLDIYS
jgi:hypothetical protein